MNDKQPIEELAAHTLDGGLRELARLRNIEILLQAGALATLVWGLGYPLPLAPLAATLLALALYNAWSWRRLRARRPIRPLGFFARMLPDILALTVVFFYTGGATNPFIWIYLFPLVITATALPQRYAWFMVALTVTCYSLLMFFYRPLPGSPVGHQMSGFSLHVYGMWVGFVLSAVLIAYFIGRLASELRERDRALARAREQALRDERIVALGALAAGAAHELGTPLATIGLLADEIGEELTASASSGIHALLDQIRRQVRRCKHSLSVLAASSQGEGQASAGRVMPAVDFVEQLVADWRRRHPGTHPRVRIEDLKQARLLGDETLRQALRNILDNAAEASPKSIELRAARKGGRLWLCVSDRGPGILAGGGPSKQGLGLGLFLAHATLRRIGGEARLITRDHGGTRTEIEIPLVEDE